MLHDVVHHEIFECAHLVSGRSKQASKHKYTQCSHTSVVLAQARPKLFNLHAFYSNKYGNSVEYIHVHVHGTGSPLHSSTVVVWSPDAVALLLSHIQDIWSILNGRLLLAGHG